jgi:tetratricopeptide (TPR) repeat protein
MTTFSFRGLLAASVAVAALSVSAAQAADAPPKLSAGVAKQIIAAQKAAQAGDWAGAKTALDAATLVSNRTPYDDYEIQEFTLLIDANTNDIPGAAAAAQAAADSPAAPEADKQKNYKNATQLSLMSKQYDKAADYARKLQATNPTDTGMIEAMGQAYFFAKDYPSAIAVTQKLVDADIAAKRKPSRNALEVLLNSQVAAKDEEGAEKTLEVLVASYNDPNDWQQMIDVAFGTKGLRDIDAVWLGRLLFLSGATVSASDASIVGSTASHLTFFGDAQEAQKRGGTGFANADAQAAKDKASLAVQAAAAAKSPSGQLSAALADAYYGYGMYPEAEAQARQAMTKGGARDPSEPPMVLGQALAAQGKYDDALAAFEQVKAGGPATPRIVRLWEDYVNIKKNPPAPAAPAAAAK